MKTLRYVLGGLILVIAVAIILETTGVLKKNEPADTNESSIARLSNVKVAMTYDDVEKILGKPTAISRGFNELEPGDFGDLILAEFALKKMKELNDSTFWGSGAKKITTKGNLIYVRWDYPILKSAMYWSYRIGSWKDSTTTAYRIDYVGIFNGKEYLLSENIYNDATVGKDYAVYIIDASRNEAILYHSGASVADADKKNVKLEKLFKRQVALPRSIKSPQYVRQNWKVTYNEAVYFDAPSGRVVQVGLNPVAVSAAD